MNNDVYNTNLIVRMTDQEKQVVKELATRNGVSMSDYVRACILDPPEVSRKEYNDIKRMINYEIRKLGVNVNQIAKKYNEYAYVEPSIELIDKLNRILDLMYKLNIKIDSYI